MFGGSRITPDDDFRSADERSRDGGVHPIEDVLAELLDQYRGRFPDINVMVIEQPPTVK